jgi:hypothetical protein
MLSFQEQMEKDIDLVLFNTAEAAREMTVNGIRMPVIEDNQKLDDLKAKAQYAGAVSAAEKLIFVRSVDFGEKPANESILTIGDELFRVMSCTDYNGGLWYQIVLEVNG